MSPKKQRIAIADCQGFVRTGRHRWTHPNAHGISFALGGLPDYLHDLNAMREAFLTLADRNQAHFCQHLVFLCETTAKALNATAAQRAEAFLRTVRKWEGST